VADQPLAYRYRDMAIKTANPLQLVVILYDAAIHSLKEAQEHLKHKDIGRRSRSINRATSVISELQGCLNFKEGGEIAVSLDRLYDYSKHQIFKANIEQKTEPLSEIVRLLDGLRSAWCELAAQSQRLESASSESQVPRGELLKDGTTGQTLQRSLSISG
jgi:flagellar secretion chaperone FliS